jgi:hypothetical protein
MKAQVIKVDGTIVEVEPKNGTDFSLEEMYEHTGSSMVQFVNSNDGRFMIVDEEGRLFGKEINTAATELYSLGEHPGYELVGDVLICSPEQIK